MATNFPGSLDSFTNPTSGSTLDSPSHAGQHANINDAMEAVQAKLGTGAGTIGEGANFTPVWEATGTNPSLGNGTLVGEYMRVNDLVVAKYDLVIGSTTTFGTGTWYFSYPVTPAGEIAIYQIQGYGVTAANGGLYPCTPVYRGGSSNGFYVNTSATYGGSGSYLRGTYPASYTTNDVLRMTIIYRGA